MAGAFAQCAQGRRNSWCVRLGNQQQANQAAFQHACYSLAQAQDGNRRSLAAVQRGLHSFRQQDVAGVQVNGKQRLRVGVAGRCRFDLYEAVSVKVALGGAQLGRADSVAVLNVANHVAVGVSELLEGLLRAGLSPLAQGAQRDVARCLLVHCAHKQVNVNDGVRPRLKSQRAQIRVRQSRVRVKLARGVSVGKQSVSSLAQTHPRHDVAAVVNAAV